METMEQYRELNRIYEEHLQQDTKTGRATLGTTMCVYRTRSYMTVHKKADAFLVMCHNTPFIEVYHNHFILIAPPPDSTHYTNSMNSILNAILWTEKEKRHFFIQRRLDPRLNMRVCHFRGKRFLDHCILGADAEPIYTDFDKVKVEVDVDRVKEIRKKIRNYFKPFEVLIRLQATEEQVKQLVDRPWNKNLTAATKLLDQHMVDAKNYSPLVVDTLQSKALVYIAAGATMEIEAATLITVICNSYVHRYHGHASFLKRIKKARDILRLRFTQGCTKVMFDKYIPEEAYVKYKSLVLQQTDGLRSLQVPSQAEVSGQGTGAISTAA